MVSKMETKTLYKIRSSSYPFSSCENWFVDKDKLLKEIESKINEKYYTKIIIEIEEVESSSCKWDFINVLSKNSKINHTDTH
tara:strand:- start:371 stop:616 length:246 start_codon:yes stop_codon:yes gene_type:complete